MQSDGQPSTYRRFMTALGDVVTIAAISTLISALASKVAIQMGAPAWVIAIPIAISLFSAIVLVLRLSGGFIRHAKPFPNPSPSRSKLPGKSPGGGQPMFCTLCGGIGKLAGASNECDLCAGYGYIYTYRSDQPACPACDETGKLSYDASRPCFKCDGDGRLPKQFPEDQPPTNKNNFRDEEERRARLERYRNRSPLAELFRAIWPFGLPAFAFVLFVIGVVAWYVFFSGEVAVAWRNGKVFLDWAK